MAFRHTLGQYWTCCTARSCIRDPRTGLGTEARDSLSQYRRQKEHTFIIVRSPSTLSWHALLVRYPRL
eukprot:1069001-Rhodomonas_salina.2